MFFVIIVTSKVFMTTITEPNIFATNVVIFCFKMEAQEFV